jgi:hypothetical protein
MSGAGDAVEDLHGHAGMWYLLTALRWEKGLQEITGASGRGNMVLLLEGVLMLRNTETEEPQEEYD